MLPAAQTVAPDGGTAEAIKLSKPKSLGKPQHGKSLLPPGQEPVPRNIQRSTSPLTLQSTVLRICLSDSLLRASMGFGWATMCWRLDLAIAFLENTGGPAISSGEEEWRVKACWAVRQKPQDASPRCGGA